MSHTLTYLLLPLLFQAPLPATFQARPIGQRQIQTLPVVHGNWWQTYDLPDVEVVLPMPKPKIVLAGEPKGKPKAADWIKFTGVGTVKGKELIVGNVAYEVKFANKTPGEGRLIEFQGTFDGSLLQCQSWSRPVEGRKPFVSFTAEGSVKLVAPGKDLFLVHSLSWVLPFVDEAIQDAAEAGQRVRVTGGLEWSESAYSYRVTRMEVVK
jgi:hypothetical protein